MSPIAKYALRLALTAAALILIGVTVDLGTMLETLRHGSISLLLLASAMVLPNVLLDAWTWRELLAPMLFQHPSTSEKGEAPMRTSEAPDSPLRGRRLPLHLVLRSVLAGYTAAFFTPARVGEFGGRALTLAPSEADAFDGWDVSITVGAQRIIDTMVAVSFGWLAMAWVRATGALSPGWNDAAVIGLWIGSAVVVALTATIARPEWIGSMLRAVAPGATGLHMRAALLRRVNSRTAFRVTAGCTVRYLVFAAQLTVLVRAFAPDASVLDLTVATAVTYYIKFLIPSLTVLDVGVREGAAILAFSWMGVPGTAALNASLIIFFVNLAFPAAIGAFFLKRRALPAAPSQTAT